YSYYSKRIELAENAALVLLHEGVVSMLIFFDGVLEFYRSKEMAGSAFDAARAFREISSSMLIYRERHPGRTVEELYYAAPPEYASDFGSLVAEASGKVHTT